MTETNFEQPFPLGAPNEAFAQYFIGQSYLAPLTDGGSVPVSNVTFEPGNKATFGPTQTITPST